VTSPQEEKVQEELYDNEQKKKKKEKKNGNINIYRHLKFKVKLLDSVPFVLLNNYLKKKEKQ
jgi:hypothetical protein